MSIRNRVLSIILCVAFSSVLLVGCGNGEESAADSNGYQKINLSMAVNGTDTQIDTLVGNYFAELVNERSGGQITIDVFPNDTLAGGNATKGIEYVCTGSTDLAAYATCVLANIEPKISVATLPWTFESYTEARQVIDEQGYKYYTELLENKGLTYLGSFHNGFRQLTNSKHAVLTPDDLKGLKIRVPGSKVYMEVFKAFGANPTAMSWSEVFTAIQQGTIDGQENGCTVTQSAKMNEVQDYLTIWNYSYESDLFIANTEVWNGLDEKTQDLLSECAVLACEWGRDKVEKEEEEIIEAFKEDGMQVDILTEEQLAVFQEDIADTVEVLKKDYGKDACSAFNIPWDE